MSAEIASIHAIYRYPVKGLSPEPLTRTRLAVGETLPADRLYAIENGPSGFDPAAPRYQPKQRYLMLMRNERLARLRTRFEDANHTLAIELDGQEAARGDLRTRTGRATIERFFAEFCADELRGAPRVLHAPGFSFSDVARKVVSIVNLASVTAVESLVGKAVHPLRFRANLYVSGWPAWREFELVGRQIAIGKDAQLKIVKRIVRCAAIDVDPETGDPRSRDPARADAKPRACRLRRLWRGGEGRRDCRRRRAARLSRAGFTRPGRRSLTPTQQEHRLLAEQVPEPPRRVEAQRPAPGVERHRLLHLGADDVAELAEVLDGAEMDVGRILPGVGQVVGARHVAAEQRAAGGSANARNSGNDTIACRPMRSMCSSTTRGCRVACRVCDRMT